MKINLKIQTDIQNKSEKDSIEPLTLTDFSRSPKERLACLGLKCLTNKNYIKETQLEAET